MSPPSQFANEIARLMRDPDALRGEQERMPRSGHGGHYDPNQPRVPAGHPDSGRWTDGRSAGPSALAERLELAQAQTQPTLTPGQVAAICALDPAKLAADFANTLLPAVGRVDPITGEVRTLDWVRQQAYEMEQTVRKTQEQLCPRA